MPYKDKSKKAEWQKSKRAEITSLKIGDNFERLTILQFGIYGNKSRQWCTCQCECGQIVKGVRTDKLKSGRRKSCGCLKREIIEFNKKHNEELKRTRAERQEKERLNKKIRMSKAREAASKRLLQQLDYLPWESKEDRRSTVTVRYKHGLVRALEEEGVSKEDPLWNINFYRALLWEGICHYCKSSLSPTGLALDRMDHDKQHVATNVVPCCGFCNMLFKNFVTYDEKMLLAPVLQVIRRRRQRKGFKVAA